MQSSCEGLNDPDQANKDRIKILELEARLKAFQNQEQRVKELELKNRQLLEELNDERAARNNMSEISGISRISQDSGSSRFMSSQAPQVCKYLSELLEGLKERKSTDFILGSDNYSELEKYMYEAKILFSQKDIESFASRYAGLEKKVKEFRRNQIENGATYKNKEVKPEPEEMKKIYDCRILVNSCFELLQQERWRIEFKDWEDYKIKREQESVCVSMVGHEKMGKSFIISELLGYEVPQGKNVPTVGINILYPNEEFKDIHCIALDTPGTNVSIRLELMKEELKDYFAKKNLQGEEILRRLYGDNIIMESLLHEFIVENADVLLVVVDKLRRDDQQFVNSIREKNQLKKKRTLIIHNLNGCLKMEDVKRAIKDDITDTYKVEEKTIPLSNNQTIEIYEENEEKQQIRGHTTHIVMAHEWSEAGEYCNKKALEYMRAVIRDMNCRKKLDLIKAFEKHLNDTFLQHFYTETEDVNEIEKFTVAFNTEADPEPACFMLNNAKNYDFKWNVMNELGILNFYVKGRLDKVPCAVKLLKEAGIPKSVLIEFEVSGECDDEQDLRIRWNDTIKNGTVLRVEIKGESRDNILRPVGQGVNQTILKNTRSFGRFTVEIPEINIEGFVVDRRRNWKGYEISRTQVSGLKIVIIPLVRSEI